MGKYLPIIVPVTAALFLLIFGYFYIRGIQLADIRQSSAVQNNSPTEIPKTLSDQTRIEDLEGSVATLVDQLNSLKASIAQASPQTQTLASVDLRLKALEAASLELKSRVAVLEKPSTAPDQQKFPLYIPLGTGGTSGDQNWITIPTYEVTFDTGDYPGFTGIVLEVNMKLNQASGTGYARLYNSTNNVAISSELSTTSDKYGWFTSSGFTLSSGKKTYQLQLKSSSGTEISIQNARLKVNF